MSELILIATNQVRTAMIDHMVIFTTPSQQGVALDDRSIRTLYKKALQSFAFEEKSQIKQELERGRTEVS